MYEICQIIWSVLCSMIWHIYRFSKCSLNLALASLSYGQGQPMFVANDLLYVAFFRIRSASSISQLCGLRLFWAINFHSKLLGWLCWFDHCCSHECFFFCTTVISNISTGLEGCLEIVYVLRSYISAGVCRLLDLFRTNLTGD